MQFKAVEHRLEYVATIGGVEYYNDSKATNVDATIKALESFPANIHLILGGKDKGSDYTVLNELLRERVKSVYTIGAAAEKIQSQIKGTTQIVSSGTLDAAVRQASAAARPGDVVLLAPACASFDQFQNYEQRGRVFKELVRQLAVTQARPATPANHRSNPSLKFLPKEFTGSQCLRGEMKFAWQNESVSTAGCSSLPCCWFSSAW